MRETKLNEILARVKSFPSMPGAGAKMLTLLEQPDTSVAEIEAFLCYDPGLTANVLKLADSAYFSIPSEIGARILANWNLPNGFRNAEDRIYESPKNRSCH